MFVAAPIGYTTRICHSVFLKIKFKVSNFIRQNMKAREVHNIMKVTMKNKRKERSGNHRFIHKNGRNRDYIVYNENFTSYPET